MKRFKDTNEINNVKTAAVPPGPGGTTTKLPKSPGFLTNPSLFYWDTKMPKSLGKSSKTGAPLLRKDMVRSIQSARRALEGKAQLDEQISFALSLTGTGGSLFGMLKSIGSNFPEFTYFLPAITGATTMSAIYQHLKPAKRAELLARIPHTEDTIKEIEDKTYRIIETPVGGGAPNIENYTLPQIAAQLRSSKLKDGQWINDKFKREFENLDDVNKINHALHHQNMSDLRDGLMSFGAIPAALATAGMINAVVYNRMQSGFEKGKEGRAQQIQEIKAPPTAPKQDITEGYVKVPNMGYQKYTRIRELKDGTYEYFVPTINRWVKESR